MPLLDTSAVVDDPRDAQFPLPRNKWIIRAHVPDVLRFEPCGERFAELITHNPGYARHMFAMAACDMTGLGSATTVNIDGTVEAHPERAQAYLDAILMGERRDIRAAYIQDGPGKDGKIVGGSASSCGLFIRTLYKLFGIKDPHGSYDRPYENGKVIGTEHDMAKDCGALVEPTNGDTSRLPKEGDAIHFQGPEKDRQHFFVVVNPFDKATPLSRGSRFVPGFHTSAAQGGQYDPWIGGKGDTATNQGTYDISIEDWTIVDRYGTHKVDWWIDLGILASRLCGTREVLLPRRGLNRWSALPI
jgi:hypothetical protein